MAGFGGQNRKGPAIGEADRACRFVPWHHAVLSALIVQALILLQVLACGTAQAQRFPGEESWRPLLTHEGVDFRYLYYRRADGKNAGVVLMLENVNDYAVAYSFSIVFKSEDDEVVRAVTGSLEPGQRKTGSNDSLSWIPWKDQRAIGHIGLRGYSVTPKKNKKGAEPCCGPQAGVIDTGPLIP